MFKFGKKKSLQIDDPEPIMRSKSNSFALVSPRPHHSITFNGVNRRHSEKPSESTNEQLKYGRKTLPLNYAENLLNLEIELELNENVQIETIQELIHMYMAGVEYYESIKDRKHIYFQRKLNTLMLKPAFLMSTTKKTPQKVENDSSEQSTASNNQDVVQSQLKKKEFQDQQKKLELDLIYGEERSKEAKVQEIVLSHSEQQKRFEDLIQQTIISQEDQIKKRLEQRKKQGLTKSCSLPKLTVEQSTLEFVPSSPIDNSQSEQHIIVNKKINEIQEEEEEEHASRKGSVMRQKNVSVSPFFPSEKRDYKELKEQKDQENKEQKDQEPKEHKIQDPKEHKDKDPKEYEQKDQSETEIRRKRQSALLQFPLTEMMKKSTLSQRQLERSRSFPTKEYLKIIINDPTPKLLNEQEKTTILNDLQSSKLFLEKITKRYA